MTTTQLIKSVANSMDTTNSTNKQIADEVELKHGIRPSNQLLISAIGAAKDRKLRNINGEQIRSLKKYCDKQFNGSFTDMKQACILARENEL